MFHLTEETIAVVRIVIQVMSIVVFTHLGFYTILALFGLKRPQRTYEIQEDNHKFLFLIPAHNEEAVIGNCLRSIASMDYDPRLVQVVVLADHCKDNTAQIAKQFSWVTIFENTYKTGENRGKPHVIGKYFNLFKEQWQKVDYVVFLDADNLVSTNYLKELNSQFISNPGYTIIQGYLDTKNVSESLMSRGYAAAYYITNRSIQYAKHRMGWNTAVGGTGFALSTNYLIEQGWNPRSYTEDFEIQVELSIRGEESTWNHFAKVYDEKPNSLQVSHTQRTRWSQGHWYVGISKTKDQLLSLCRRQKMISWFNRLETLVYSYSMLRAVWIFILLILIVIDVRFLEDFPQFFSAFWFWVIFEVLNYLVIPITYIVQEGKNYFEGMSLLQKIKEYFLLWIGFFYSTTFYYFAQVKGFFTWFLPQNNWKKTVHSSSMTNNDLEN